MHKPSLTVPQQIEHMKHKNGIKFEIATEKDAELFLANHTYYFRAHSVTGIFDIGYRFLVISGK